jgi:hypothetical protein
LKFRDTAAYRSCSVTSTTKSLGFPPVERRACGAQFSLRILNRALAAELGRYAATSIEKAEGGGVKGIVCCATPSAVLLA